MTMVVGVPVAACAAARPLTASPSPPVLAKGQHSAVRCTAGKRPPALFAVPAGACVVFAFPRRDPCFSRSSCTTRPTSMRCPTSPRQNSHGGRIIRRQLPPRYRNVILRGVLLHHPARCEVLAGHTHRMLHPLDPPRGDAAGVPLVVQGHHLVFEQVVEVAGIR